MTPMEISRQRRSRRTRMLRRIYQKEQKGKKGASGYALRTLLAELKSGQFICSKSGQFYLLTTDKLYLCSENPFIYNCRGGACPLPVCCAGTGRPQTGDHKGRPYKIFIPLCLPVGRPVSEGHVSFIPSPDAILTFFVNFNDNFCQHCLFLKSFKF